MSAPLTDAFFPSGALDALAAVQASAYDHLCAVQRYTAAKDAGGFPVKTWATVAEDVPCSIKDIVLRSASGERIVAGQTDAPAAVLVKMDTSPDFTPSAKDRLVMDGGAVLSIEAQPEDVHGAGRWWHLTCRRT